MTIILSETPDTLDAELFRLLFPIHLAVRELEGASPSTTGQSNSSQVYTYVAGADIQAGRLVSIVSDVAVIASRSLRLPAIGLALTSAAKGEEVNVLQLGYIQLEASFSQTAKYLYLGTHGLLTTSPASSGELHQQVATITGPKSLHFFPLIPIRRR